MTSPTFKKQYTFVLSLVFIAVGCYKLYERFYVGKDIATYQIALAVFLIGLGLYQIAAPYLIKKKH